MEMILNEKLMERLIKRLDFEFDEKDIIDALEALLDTIDELEEKNEKLEEDLKENYRPVPVVEQVAISVNDFI